MRALVGRVVGIIVSIVLGTWALVKFTLDWLGRSTAADDYNQLVERMPVIVAWLVSTPWWLPGALATGLTGFLVWANWPAGFALGAGSSKKEQYRRAGVRASAIAHEIDKNLRFRLDPPGPILAEAATLMIYFYRFGLTIPSFPRDLSIDDKLMLSRNYLGTLGPVLREGHIREAKQLAASLSAEINESLAQKPQ